jgi:hypothetical protein
MDHDQPIYRQNGEIDALGERLRYDAVLPGLAGGIEAYGTEGSRLFPAGSSYTGMSSQGYWILAYQSPSFESYTYYDGHDGHDFAVSGQALATADGEVAFLGDYGNTLGRVVELYHPQGYLTRYAHLAGFATDLQVGTKVTAGQPIGAIGGSAVIGGQMRDNYWGVHLHFSVFRWNENQKSWQVTDPFGWDPWAGPDQASRSRKQQEDPLIGCNGEVSYDLWVDQWPRLSSGSSAATAFHPTQDRYVGGWLGETAEPTSPTQAVSPLGNPTNPPAPPAPTAVPAQPSGIIGAWEQAPDQGDWGLLFTRIEFFQDGTFLLNWMNTSGQYSFPDPARLKLENPGGTLMYEFSLSGDSLTLVDAGGGAWRFQRIGSTPGNPANPPAPTAVPAQPSSIIGAWEQAPDQGGWGLLFTRIEFFQDGTFLLNWMNTSGQYSFPDPTRLKLENPGGTLMYEFSLSGDSLTLIDAGGGAWRFQRVK